MAKKKPTGRSSDTKVLDPWAEIPQIVQALAQIERVLRNMKMQDDVLGFGHRELQRRVARLERRMLRDSDA